MIKNVRKKIMVIDDDPAIVDAMKMMLELSDYDVATATNANTLQTVRSEKPDLLLLDIWLSGADGRTFCKKIKHDEGLKDLPVILISASKDVDKSAQMACADDFLEKPFEMDELLEKVEKYTEKN